MRPQGKAIFYVLTVGIIFNAIALYFTQQNLKVITLEQKFSWYTTLGFLGDGLMSVGAILSFIKYQKAFPTYVRVCYVAVVLLVTLASLSSLETVLKTPSIFYSTKGIGTYINIGILFFTANEFYMKKILNIFYRLSFVFLVFGLANLVAVGRSSDRHEFLFAIREYTLYLFWIFPFFLFQDFEKKGLNVINYFVFFLILLFVIATGSRGYIILYTFLFLVKLYQENKKSKSAANILILGGVIAVIAGIGFVLASSSSGISKTVESSVNILTGRVNDDTRSDQLTQFWSQFNPEFLIQGVGPIATWYWTEAKGQYGFLDNQFILITWWAGLPTAIFYSALMFICFLKTIYLKVNSAFAGKVLVFLWILACGGLAIYVTVSSELYYYFISFMMGTVALRQIPLKNAVIINEYAKIN